MSCIFVRSETFQTALVYYNHNVSSAHFFNRLREICVHTYLIVINVSLMVSRTVWAWVCDMRLKFLTSCLRSFAFFCRPRSWLYISGVSARSLYTYWPVPSAAGFGGGVGLCLSLSVIVHSARKDAYFPRDHPRIARTLKGFKLARGRRSFSRAKSAFKFDITNDRNRIFCQRYKTAYKTHKYQSNAFANNVENIRKDIK